MCSKSRMLSFHLLFLLLAVFLHMMAAFQPSVGRPPSRASTLLRERHTRSQAVSPLALEHVGRSSRLHVLGTFIRVLRSKCPSMSADPLVASERTIHKDSLVLLKDSQPAVVTQEGADRLEVLLLNKKTKKVHTKDVAVLHPGPVRSWELEELKAARSPDAKTLENVFHLLSDSGEATSVYNLATLIFGENTPSAAWAAWKTVELDLYFHGQPEEIYAYSRSRVAEVLAEKKRKAKQAKDWDAFLDRLRSAALGPGDADRLDDVKALALGQSSSSAVVKALGTEQTPENAHRLLLSWGVWTEVDNPWPSRCKVCMEPHKVDVDAAPPAEADRRDLTHLTAFAIDEPGVPDPDDAISIEEDGRIWVHVADVASLVSPGSPIDLEARRRGASVYLPTGSLFMLPPRATALLGLGLDSASGGRSHAISFGFRVDESGVVHDTQVCKSTIKVTRLTYEEAHNQIEAGKSPFQALWEVVQRRWRRREEDGAIAFQVTETDVQVDAKGDITVTEVVPFTSKEVVMELMLCAGEAAARIAVDAQLPFLFSSQPAPVAPGPPPKVKSLKALQRAPAPPPPPGSPAARPRTMSQIFEFRKRMQRSSLGTEPLRHHGLGLSMYSQVTSPLRRYGDLVNHYQLRAHLDGRPPLSVEEISELAAVAEEGTANAKSAERLSRQHWTMVKLLREGQWQGTGLCVGYKKSEPGAPRVATVLLESLGLICNLRLRQEVKLDGELAVRLHGVRLADLRADFVHNVVPGAIYGTDESEVYRQAARARKNVGTRLSPTQMRQGQ